MKLLNIVVFLGGKLYQNGLPDKAGFSNGRHALPGLAYVIPNGIWVLQNTILSRDLSRNSGLLFLLLLHSL